jgi:acetyl esterase/lipase
MEDLTAKPIVYSTPGMHEVSPRSDLVYKTVGGEKLLADLYLPAGKPASAPYPVVAFIHGAVPEAIVTKPKDWAAYVSWGKLIASSGMAAVTFNHRLCWKNGYDPSSVSAASADTEDLIRYIRGTSRSLGVDPDRICIAAFSAGGPLLAPLIGASPDYVRCYVGFYCYLGDPLPADPADAGRFSPLAALKRAGRKMPPFFIARAGLDLTPFNDSIDAFVEAGNSTGNKITLVDYPTGHHGFDIIDDDDTSRAIIKQAVDFMSLHLRSN